MEHTERANGVNMDNEGQTEHEETSGLPEEATVVIDLRDNKEVKAEDIIKVVKQKIGFWQTVSCETQACKEYELTLEGADVCDVLVERNGNKRTIL